MADDADRADLEIEANLSNARLARSGAPKCAGEIEAADSHKVST